MVVLGKEILKINGKRWQWSTKSTWLEHIHKSNVEKRTMAPNTVYDAAYREGTSIGIDWRDGVWTGTAAVIGKKGERLGEVVSTSCDANGSKKQVFFEPTKNMRDFPPDTVFICNHGFDSNAPVISLYDLKKGIDINNDQEMSDAEHILLRFRPNFVKFRTIKQRLEENFDFICIKVKHYDYAETKSEPIFSRTSFGFGHTEDVGLFHRSFKYGFDSFRDVQLGNPISHYGIMNTLIDAEGVMGRISSASMEPGMLVARWADRD